uniref:THAP-type domain-containing protein n=1 Tax=Ceratitis capitata TaxID=7213 RepID=W8BM48_CERCA
MKCAVFGCTNGYKKSAVECSLFTFPTNPSLARKWMKFCRQGKGFNFKNCVICMDHFEREDVVNNLQYELGFANKRILKRDVVPTIYKVQVEKQKITEEQPSDRVRRRENRNILSEAPTSHEGFSKRRLLKNGAVPTLYKDNVEQEIDEATKLENKRIVDELLKQYDADLTKAEELKETTIDISENMDEDIEDFLKNEHTLIENQESQNPLHVSYTQNSGEVSDTEQKLIELKRANDALQKENSQHRIELAAAKRILIGEQRRHRYAVQALSKRLTIVETQKKNYEKKLESIFSKSQIEMIKNGNSVSWSTSDIEAYKVIYTTNSTIYKFLLEKGFPLPSIRLIESSSPSPEISKIIKRVQEQEQDQNQNELQQQDADLYEEEQQQQSPSSLQSLMDHSYSEEIEFEILNE